MRKPSHPRRVTVTDAAGKKLVKRLASMSVLQFLLANGPKSSARRIRGKRLDMGEAAALALIHGPCVAAWANPTAWGGFRLR